MCWSVSLAFDCCLHALQRFLRPARRPTFLFLSRPFPPCHGIARVCPDDRAARNVCNGFPASGWMAPRNPLHFLLASHDALATPPMSDAPARTRVGRSMTDGLVMRLPMNSASFFPPPCARARRPLKCPKGPEATGE